MSFLKDIYSAPQNKLMDFPKKQDITRLDGMTHNVDVSRVFLRDGRRFSLSHVINQGDD